MRATVHLRLPDGSLAEVEHGDLVGRLWSAAVRVDDPRVSEAHALLSLRGGRFWLLALRRMLGVGGRAVSEVALVPGLAVELAEGLVLTVEAIALPADVLALEAPGMPTQALPLVCSVRGVPLPQVTPSYRPDSPCVIWGDGAGWRLRLGAEERALALGDTFEVEGVPFTVVRLSLDLGGPGTTHVAGGVHTPLRLVCSFDSVQVHREDEPVLVLTGVNARIVSEIVALGLAAEWRVVAREIWTDAPNELTLRNRWDVGLARLRARLRDARIRQDLVFTDGRGVVALLLRADDVVQDRS